MYVVLVTAFPHPAQNDLFMAEMTRNAIDSVKYEKGCYRFEYMRRNESPLCYVLIELYADRDAFELHRETEHFRRWNEVSQDILAKPLEVQAGEMVHPLALDKE
jgi:(4S)-4-hydroxy-5-phosphonooxypentane-2,3-dione isomerase